MSDAPMHPNQPSPDDDFYADSAFAGWGEGHGDQSASPLGAHDGDQHDPFNASSGNSGDGSWLLEEDPSDEPAVNVEQVHALPNEFGGTAVGGHWAEGDGEYADYAEGDYAEGEYAEGEYAEGEYADGEYPYGDEGQGASPINEDDLVGASYVEPEPAGRAVSRALVPAAIVLVLSFGAVGGWAVYRDGGRLSDVDESQTAKIETRQTEPGAAPDPLAELAPIEGDAAVTTGRMGLQHDGSVREIGGPTRVATPTFDTPREPGELEPAKAVRPSFDRFSETEVQPTRPAMTPDIAAAPPAPIATDETSETSETSEPATLDVANADEGPDGYDFEVETYVEPGGLGYSDLPTTQSSEALAFDESLLPELDPESFVLAPIAPRIETAEGPGDDNPLAAAFAAVGHQPVRPRFPFEFVLSGALDDEPVVAVDATPEATGDVTTAPRDPSRERDADETYASLPFGLFEDELPTVEVARSDAEAGAGMSAQDTVPSTAGDLVADAQSVDDGKSDSVDVDAAHATLDEIFGAGADVAATELAPADDASGEDAVAVATPDAVESPDAVATATPAEVTAGEANQNTEGADVEVAGAEPVRVDGGAALEAAPAFDAVALDAEPTVADSGPIYGPPAPVVPEISDIYPVPVEVAAVEDAPNVEAAETQTTVAVAPEGTVVAAGETQTTAAPEATEGVADQPTVAVSLAEPEAAPPAPESEPAAQPTVAAAPPAPAGAAVPEVLPSIADDDSTPRRTPVLRRIDDASIWVHRTVPKSKVGGDRLVLTPNVGNVRVVFDGGESIDGRLHGVGQDKFVLDTSLGRITLEARRADRIDRLGGGSLRRPGTSGDSTNGLDRVRVRTAGGTFDGHLLDRDGDQVTLLLGEGVRVTVTATDVAPARRSKTVSRIRAHDVGEIETQD